MSCTFKMAEVIHCRVRQNRTLPAWRSRPLRCSRLIPTVRARYRDTDKEKSRKYRRTTFSHDDWANHRSTSRYWRHLRSGLLASRIVRGLAAPLIYVGLISLAVSSYEQALATGMLHDIGAWHWPSLSMSMSGPFSLSTFALSLLLVFRTNSSYQRWNEARRLWGLCTNRSRDIARQSLQWMPADTDAELIATMLRWTAAFPAALMCSLRQDHTLAETLQDVLLPGELQLLLAQPHPGTACLQAMGACVTASRMTALQKMRIDENITVMQDVMGGCERIFKTPIPLSYTRHTSRFLVCWLTLLPFCVADAFGWLTVPISIGLAFFLFGIEEIGVQIEEPFGILALEVFCESIQKNIHQAQALSQPFREAASTAASGSVAAASVDQLAREFNQTLMLAAGTSHYGMQHHNAISQHSNGNSSSSSSSIGQSKATGVSHSVQAAVLRSPMLLEAVGQEGSIDNNNIITHIQAEEDAEVYLKSSVDSGPADDEGYNF